MSEIILSGVFASMMSDLVDVKLKKDINSPEIEVLVKINELKKADSETLSKKMNLPKELLQKILKGMERKKFIQHCSPEYCIAPTGEDVLQFIQKNKKPMLNAIQDDPILKSLVMASQPKA